MLHEEECVHASWPLVCIHKRHLRTTWNSVSCCISSSCSLLLLRGGMMLKKTLSKSRLSPDTLDKVKMGVMLPGRTQAHNQDTQPQTTLASSCYNRAHYKTFNRNQVHILIQLCLCSSFILGWLCELLCCRDGVVCTAYNQGHLVAARLFQDTLQLPNCALHSGPRTQVHLTDDDEDGHLQGHGEPKMLPCCSSWKRVRRRGCRE